MEYAYLVRWDRQETFGADFADFFNDGFGQYVYVKQLSMSRGGRGIWTTHLENEAIAFGSWAEAAAFASFIIFHVDGLYEDALDIVRIEL